MKEGAPQEIGGIDVTNVSEDKQKSYVDGVRSAVHVDSAIAHATSELEREREMLEPDPHNMLYAQNNIDRAQAQKIEDLEWARGRVNRNPDPDLARAEMERALKKDIEEKLG